MSTTQNGNLLQTLRQVNSPKSENSSDSNSTMQDVNSMYEYVLEQMCIRHPWSGVVELCLAEMRFWFPLPEFQYHKQKTSTQNNRKHPHYIYIHRKKDGPHAAQQELRECSRMWRALILLQKPICLKYVLLCFRFEGPAIRLPVWAGPCLFSAFLLSSVFCFSSSCWVYGRMCHLIWLILLQVLERNSQCCAGYTGRPVCSLTFPQTLPWLWESPLIAVCWNQHVPDKQPL